MPGMSNMPENFAQEWAERLKLLAHPDRLHIVACLLEKPATLTELATQVSKDVSTVWTQLQVLVETGIVGRDDDSVYALSSDVSLAWLGIGENTTLDLGCCRLELTGR